LALTPISTPSTTPSATPTSESTTELTPEAVATETEEATTEATIEPTAAVEATASPTQAAVVLPGATPIAPDTGTPDGGGRLPIELLVGGLLLGLVLIYVILYWRGAAAAERYVNGFIIERCPVCGRGDLHVETRQDRVLGIPRARHTVRCSNCRSTLRDVGGGRWRYAIDRAANASLYNQWNGKVIDEPTLKSLQSRTDVGRQPRVRPPTTPPTFIDDDDGT
jgi:hypothetical protein